MPAKMCHRYLKGDAKGEEHFQHEIQILIDIRHHLHAFRTDGHEKAEHQREDQKVAEGHAGVEEHHAGKQQGKGEALFTAVQPGGHESPQLMQ